MTLVTLSQLDAAGRTTLAKVSIALARYVKQYGRIPEHVLVSSGNWDDLNYGAAHGDERLGVIRQGPGLPAALTVRAYGREVIVGSSEDLGDCDFRVTPEPSE